MYFLYDIFNIKPGSSSAVDYDENIMDILINMGFPREAVKRALFYTYNQGLECAIKWLMDHITDNNFAEPFVPSRHNFNSGELIIITFYSD